MLNILTYISIKIDVLYKFIFVTCFTEQLLLEKWIYWGINFNTEKPDIRFCAILKPHPADTYAHT